MGAAVSLPRPRLLEALRDDSRVKAALADGAVLAVVPLVRARPRLRLDAHRAFIVEVAAGGAFTPDLGLRRALP